MYAQREACQQVSKAQSTRKFTRQDVRNTKRGGLTDSYVRRTTVRGQVGLVQRAESKKMNCALKGVDEKMHEHISMAYAVLKGAGLLDQINQIPEYQIQICPKDQPFTRKGVIAGTSHYIFNKENRKSKTISTPDIESALKEVGKPTLLISIIEILADPKVYQREGGKEGDTMLGILQTIQTLVHEISLHALKITDLWPLLKKGEVTNKKWEKENEKGMPQSEVYQHAMAQDPSQTQYIEMNKKVQEYISENVNEEDGETYGKLWEAELKRFKEAYTIEEN